MFAKTAIIEAVLPAPVAHPVTHENVMLRPQASCAALSGLFSSITYSQGSRPGLCCATPYSWSAPDFGCRAFPSLVQTREGHFTTFLVVPILNGRPTAIRLKRMFEHASSHYEFVTPAPEWLPEDFRVGRCALVRQRILRCRPHRGLYYKGCAGPKPACSL